MHCLPAFHDLNTQIGQEIYDKYGLAELEITDQVFQKYSDIIFQEAENRMHSIKAIMYNSLEKIFKNSPIFSHKCDKISKKYTINRRNTWNHIW